MRISHPRPGILELVVLTSAGFCLREAYSSDAVIHLGGYVSVLGAAAAVIVTLLIPARLTRDIVDPVLYVGSTTCMILALRGAWRGEPEALGLPLFAWVGFAMWLCAASAAALDLEDHPSVSLVVLAVLGFTVDLSFSFGVIRTGALPVGAFALLPLVGVWIIRPRPNEGWTFSVLWSLACTGLVIGSYVPRWVAIPRVIVWLVLISLEGVHAEGLRRAADRDAMAKELADNRARSQET